MARALAADPPILSDGRAVQRRRPGGPRGIADRDPAAAKRTAQDDRLRHARHRRGDQARREGRRVRPGRRARSSTTRPDGCCPTRPTTSSPASSAPTAVTAACSSAQATGLPLHDIRTVGESGIDSMDLEPGDWALVIKPDGSPYAWIDANGVGLHRQGKSLYDSTIAGGSLFPPNGTMRLALDAALSSPAGLGVAVDERKQVIGGVKADDVIAALKTKQRDHLVRYLLTHLDDAWELTLIHLWLSLVPLVLGLLIAVPLGRPGPPDDAAAPAHDGDGEHHLHHPVAGVVRRAAADHPDADPRRGQRHRRPDAVHRRAAGAGRPRGARRRAARGARRRHGRRLQAADPDR